MRGHSDAQMGGSEGFATTRRIHADGTCAMLRQGRRDGWTPESYERVAAYFDRRDPIACLYWSREARRSRR